jgi:(1->4)-alpha-D-glucan 1-alpha-D-glucosylmutase
MIPRATYRMQFHKGFTFADALPLAPYLQQLGISHLYASPILAARAGSTHGYDVIDPTRINPELGGEEGFAALVSALRAHGLGLIVDIVPNHMAVGGADNPWWLDVLEAGQASPYSGMFDIDWDTPDVTMRGKLLVPLLGKPLEDTVADGDLKLIWDERLGKLAFAYAEHRFSVAARGLSPRDGRRGAAHFGTRCVQYARSPARAAHAAALSACILASRSRVDQLAPLLRHHRTGGASH